MYDRFQPNLITISGWTMHKPKIHEWFQTLLATVYNKRLIPWEKTLRYLANPTHLYVLVHLSMQSWLSLVATASISGSWISVLYVFFWMLKSNRHSNLWFLIECKKLYGIGYLNFNFKMFKSKFNLDILVFQNFNFNTSLREISLHIKNANHLLQNLL